MVNSICGFYSVNNKHNYNEKDRCKICNNKKELLENPIQRICINCNKVISNSKKTNKRYCQCYPKSPVNFVKK